MRLAKVGTEKHLLRKLKKRESEPFDESLALKAKGIDKLKANKTG